LDPPVIGTYTVTLSNELGSVTSTPGAKVSVVPVEETGDELLMSAPGRVFSRTRILNQVWGYSEDPLTNVVDVYIARLRRKIDTPGREPLFETVRGHGYRLKPPA